MRKTVLLISLIFIIGCFLVIYSCSSGGGGTPNPPNPCSGVTITVSGTTTNPSSVSANDGSITATASGSSGFTFNLNGGSFQASGTFTNLAAGVYTVVAKNGSGCTGSATFTLTASGASCFGVTINVSAASTANTPCQGSNSGTITASASGGTGVFTFNINGGSFQTSNTFSSLNGGSYIVTAKDGNGCTGNTNVTVSTTAAGSLFTAVKLLVQNNCAIAGCHGDIQSPLFTDQCNIVANKALIKSRAVDGNPSPMPPTGLLPASERQKITNWINAGGLYSN